MSESMKLQILNYQRIKKASLEFVPGLNIIVGESNNGKSSIIRSLETAIYNLPREGHVTLGETKSAVGIRYKGHEVIWRRDTEAASQVTYRVDGKIYEKLGRGQPEVVKNALGISEVEINDKKFKVNFSKQMSYPFLLDATPSELFKFIVQSSEEDNVVDVLNTMRSDVNEIASNVKKYDEARNSLGTAYQREASKFKEKKQLLPYCEEVLKLESEVKKLKKLKESIDTYERCRYVVQKAEESIIRTGKIQKYIDSVEKQLTELVATVSAISDKITKYDGYLNEVRLIDTKIVECESVVCALSEIDEYVNLLDNMVPTQTRCDALKVRVDEYTRKKNEYDETVATIEEVTVDLDRKARVANAVEIAFADIESKRTDYEILTNYIGMYEVARESLVTIESELQAKRTIISDIDKDISEIGVCPYCGNELSGGKHEHS